MTIEEDEEQETYRIVRFFKDGRESETKETGLTLQEAKDHCKDPDTSCSEWFEGFEKED